MFRKMPFDIFNKFNIFSKNTGSIVQGLFTVRNTCSSSLKTLNFEISRNDIN